MDKKQIFIGVIIGIALVLFVTGVVGTISAQAVLAGIDDRTKSQTEPSKEVTLIAVGDIMLDRKVGRLINQYGLNYPLEKVKDFLKQSDLTFANLESPLGSNGSPLPGKGIAFRAQPETVDVLLQGGIDIVSLANNHMIDYDTPALEDTLDILKMAKIDNVGAGMNINQARVPVIKEVNGLKVGFLAYTEMADIFFSSSYPRAFKATEDLPGVAPLEEAHVLEDVSKLREQVDIVVVSLHWGIEYSSKPATSQRELAYKIVDAGADVILGHHPHVLQGVEIYQNSLIAYSLGNFVFDQNWASYTREGLALEIKFNKLGVEWVKVYPVHIPESQPRLLKDHYGESILNFTKDLSNLLGTDLHINDELMYGEVKPLPGLVNEL